MTPKEIVSVALRQGLFSDKRAGKTPHQTMKSKLSVHVRRNGESSPFVRTGPGKFFLRELLHPGQSPYYADPIKKPKSAEDVLVFNSRWFDEARRFQGIKKSWKKIYKDLLSPNVCSYLNRRDAETIDTHKQILTYVLVTRRGRVLTYRRGNYNRVEDFLRGAECIGFGGHVAGDDMDLFSVQDMGVTNCAIRELGEELRLPDEDKIRLRNGVGLSCVGVLNDDSSIVGQRHFAFLFQYEVSNARAWDNPERGEKSITQLRWLDPSRGVIPIWRFEYWSQLCLRAFFPDLVHTTAAYNIRRRRPIRPPNLLCVLGTVGSGKSEATRLLCTDFGYQEVNTGRIVADLLGIPPVPDTPRQLFQEAAWRFIQSVHGPEQLARAILDRIDQYQCERVLIDGIRQRTTLDNLRSLAGPRRVGLLYVHTLPDLAYQFYKERERTDCSIFDFLAVRNASVEFDVEDMIGQADAVLYNWIGLQAYRKTVRQLMQDLEGSMRLSKTG